MLIAAPRIAGAALLRLVPMGLATPALDWRSPRLPLGVLAVLMASLGLVAVLAGLLGLQAPLRYDAVPEVRGSVPLNAVPAAERAALFGLDSPALPPLPLVGARPDPAGPPLDADPALLEWRDGVGLPRIAADGRRPLDVHARTVPASVAGRARIAVLVVDLGLDAQRLEQSVQLPGAASFAHTPYAAHLPAWQRHARWHGHEVLLELPLQAHDFPASDLGPWALDPLAPAEARLSGLERVLGRSDGYVGLVAASEGFGGMPDRFAPVAEALARRGLGFVELGDDRLAAVAAEAGLDYATAVGPLDALLDAHAIDAALGQLEGRALRDGFALGFVQPYPLSFDRLWQWSRALEAKGISLVPVSALLREP